MSEREVLIGLYVLYLFTVVWRVAYIFGMEKGERNFRVFQRSLLGVGTLWKVGEDGKLYRQEVDE